VSFPAPPDILLIVVATMVLFAAITFSRAAGVIRQRPGDQLVGCGFAGGRVRGFARRGGATCLLGCNVTVTGFGL
jgi:hypothetical protein